jgi:hypothetical protein
VFLNISFMLNLFGYGDLFPYIVVFCILSGAIALIWLILHFRRISSSNESSPDD